MKRAVLYARVSSDAQKKEGTIESQVVELKKQIVRAGCALVKEYIDDGYSGAQLDRPALEQLRTDARSSLYEAVYFLNTDRIARDVVYQNIIIGEMLKQKKQIIINGVDYIHNPENKFTLTVLGAVAELERAKIAERMKRGELHRLRAGQLASHGHCTYGYTYVKKSDASSAALVINEVEARVVRSIFERYANGDKLMRITRSLEEQGVQTRKGKRLWRGATMRYMLKNCTYTGTRYFNSMTLYEEGSGELRSKRGSYRRRDRSEWFGVKVPAIISQALFDRVQERMRHANDLYRHPITRFLLSQLVECGECGAKYSSYRRYISKEMVVGRPRVYHKAAYACNRLRSQGMHATKQYKCCRNAEVATHLLEECVFELIRDNMLNPERLREWMGLPEENSRRDRSNMLHRLRRLEQRKRSVEKEKKQLISIYASERLSKDEYVKQNVEMDAELYRLKLQKVELSKGRLSRHEIITAAICAFCDRARAGFDTLADFDASDGTFSVTYQKWCIANTTWSYMARYLSCSTDNPGMLPTSIFASKVKSTLLVFTQGREEYSLRKDV